MTDLFLTFAVILGWETCQSVRPATLPFSGRWFRNITLFALGSLSSILLPFLAVLSVSFFTEAHHWGLLYLLPPLFLSTIISVVLIDMWAYCQHRLFHAISFLWRMHALHHSDLELDATTAFRHHPLEFIFEMVLGALGVFIFGFSPLAVTIYGVMATIIQIYHHGNIEMPQKLFWMHFVLMTPELHRLHHSVEFGESNSNFSTVSPLWDWLFGTLQFDTEREVIFGISEGSQSRLVEMLLLPWRVK